MAYCSNCGIELACDAKYCQKCGCSVKNKSQYNTRRYQEYAGKIIKCPNCGEILKSFELNCPSCGYELRDIQVSSAVKEFALKLETIESKRTKKSRGIFKHLKKSISQTDEQKISLIKSYSVPNSKEDMLEFIILATSNMNMKAYDLLADISESEKEITAAWFSKVQQIYEKAKRTYSSDRVFDDIKVIYDNCNKEIKRVKKKSIIKLVLMFVWIPLFWIVLIVYLSISGPREEAKELERLENIVIEVQEALDNQQYKHALRIADSIDYQRYDTEMERKWDIQREYWIDVVLKEASMNEIELEYTRSQDVNETDSKGIVGSFSEGYKRGYLDSLREYLGSDK